MVCSPRAAKRSAKRAWLMVKVVIGTAENAWARIKTSNTSTAVAASRSEDVVEPITI
jgi:hypothetical protein